MRGGGPRLAAIVIVALVLPTACQGPAEPGEERHRVETSPEPITTPAAARSGPFTIHLPGEPAATYSTVEDEPQSVLARLVMESCPGLRVAPCLERAAALYNQSAPHHDEGLPLDFAEFALHWAGCPDATVTINTILTDEDDPRAVFAELSSSLTSEDFTHLGVARGPAEAPYRWRWVVFLVDRLFSLRPVPTSGPPGESVPMLLQLDTTFTNAWVVVTLPRGETHEYEVGMNGGWAVVSVPLAEEVGRQWVEIMAERGRGPEVLALFPIEVGRTPPRFWVGEPRPDETWITTTAEAEQLAAALIRRDRQRFGLPELPLDPVLCEIARQHSADMAAAGYFAHVSPTTGSIVDRLSSKGYVATFAAENLARSSHLTDAQEALMRSPGHRAAVLTPRATRLGVGVVISEGPDRSFFVTQIYARPVE